KALGVAQRLREAYELDIISLQAASSIPGTCYWLDVRSPEQYAKGHIPQSISAPGGQLVQQVDHWCPVLGATIVLIDTDGLSATTTGIWLKLMGWQVKVLLVADLALTATNDHHRETNLTAPTADMAVLDVGESRDYKKGHVPHSVWINRSDLSTYLADKPGQTIGITAKDIDFASFVVQDLKKQGVDAVVIQRSNLTTETPIYLSPRNDVWYPPHERDEG